MPRKTKPKLACGSCGRGVPFVTNRDFIGQGTVGLCDDCNMMYDTYRARIIGAVGESLIRLSSILREWVRECRANHGTKPYVIRDEEKIEP